MIRSFNAKPIPPSFGRWRIPGGRRGCRAIVRRKPTKRALQTAKRNLKALFDAGVKIAMGTDTGPPARFQGYFEHLELEQMVDAGLTPMQALVAATGDAALCLRLPSVGTLEPGKWADFVVLDADPLVDIRNSRTVASVYVAGNRVMAPRPPAP